MQIKASPTGSLKALNYNILSLNLVFNTSTLFYNLKLK